MASMTASAGAGARAGARVVPGASSAASRSDIGIVWYKQSDLRVSDHEPLLRAHQDCAQVAHVFCFDLRWFGRTK